MQPGFGGMNPMFGFGAVNPGFPMQNPMGIWAGIYNTNNMNTNFIKHYEYKRFKVKMK